ncbi:TIGR04372 family glycosyltransferase [Pseudomonadota bacterium]
MVKRPLLIPALFVTLVIRLIRPLIMVRFGKLQSDRIGHFACNTEVYLCQRDKGMYDSPRSLDIFYCGAVVCNQQLKRMWGRVLYISPFVELLSWINRRLPGGDGHILEFLSQDRDIHNRMYNTQPHLTFSHREKMLGKGYIDKTTLGNKAPYICFVARDSAYLDRIQPRRDWSYHSYRDSDIDNYVPAMEALVERGNNVFRMGYEVKKALCSDNLKIIDYATNGDRTDFLDIYLAANCRFFVSNGTGIDDIAQIFRRPIVNVNCLPIEHVRSWNPNHISIFKKLWLRDEKRFMSFRETFETGAGRFERSEEYEQIGVDIVDNTSEEIAAVVGEMDARLNGSWRPTEEDRELQKTFWNMLPKGDLHGEINSLIGADFLRNNKELLI